MERVPFTLALSVLFVGATTCVSYAVTSEPEPPAGAPATSVSPPASATEQHEGKSMGGAQGEKDEGNKKQESQEQKAIKHTEQAITEGKAGNVAGLRKHAETALKIAEGAEKSHAEAHVEDGIKHLKMAVEEAQKGNAAEGTKHAEEALMQLQKE